MQETPYKWPIKHLENTSLNMTKENLAIIADQTHQLYKWLENTDIHKVSSNDF